MDMEKIEFTPDLITGLPAVDKQHAEYIMKLSKFVDKCFAGINEDDFLKEIQFLESYVAYHFESEEDLMRAHKYPEIDQQRKQHGYFIDKLFDIVDTVKRDGFNEEILEQTYNLAYKWFVNHIIKYDIKLAGYINSV